MKNERSSDNRKWRPHLAVFALLAVPAFTGFPLDRLPAQIVPGIRWSWMLYGLLVNATIMSLLGRRIHARILTIAALVTLPVVYAGALLTWVGLQLGLSSGSEYAAGRHYTQLCITMLSVVPLALAVVVTIPFGSIERRTLQQTRGVTPGQKKVLMALRVFDHIVFSVAPGVLTVLREERFYDRLRMDCMASGRPGCNSRREMIIRLFYDLIHLAVEVICAAMQFIPLWAHEIAQLPERAVRRRKGTRD